MTKTIYDKSRLSKLINAWAKRVIALYPTSQEWRIGITNLAIVKLGTMGISAYAAYYFFFDYIFPLFQQKEISKIVTVIIIILLELLTAVFLTKVFKFFFRKMYFTTFLVFLVTVGFYSISFISTTSGLAQRQSSKEDNSGEIKNELMLRKQQLESAHIASIKGLDNLIHDIRTNPVAWSKGKRTFLSKEQQNNIMKLELQKSVIRNNHTTLLEKVDKQFHKKTANNELKKSNISNKYYTAMAIIMAIQFIVTGILIFFLHQIYFQEYVHNSDFEAAHKNRFLKSEHIDAVREGTAHKIIKPNINGNQMYDEEYFTKHKKIVEVIFEQVHKNQTFLSNADINIKIIPRLKNVKYKSVSLIRKVFTRMQA